MAPMRVSRLWAGSGRFFCHFLSPLGLLVILVYPDGRVGVIHRCARSLGPLA